MNQKKSDVIIIGAGPAGCEAAYRLASKGFDVFVYDKELDREKPCGGGIQYKEILEFGIPDKVIERKIRKANIISPKNNILSAAMPAKMYAATVKRKDYDSYLRKRAEKVGAVFEQKKIKKLKDVSAKLIVDASGAFGIKKERSDKKKNQEICATYHVWMKGKNIEKEFKDSIELYFLSSVPKGYAWIFPKKDIISVGIGTIEKINLKKILNDFITKHPVASKKLKGFKIVQKGSGLIPLSLLPKLYSHSKNNAIISIGDAGGFANIIHGGGIYQARKSAKIAASHCVKYLKTGNIKHLKDYDKEAREWFTDYEIKWDRKIRNILWNPRLMEILVEKGKKDKKIQEALGIVLTSAKSHETAYKIMEKKMLEIIYSELNSKTDSWKKDINSRLENIFPGNSEIHLQANKVLLNSKAKRLRACIGMLASDMFNGNQEDAINFSLVYEMFHTASLIHDDIIDESDKRRGEKTLHAKYGIGNAIIAGDLMLSKGYSLISNFSDNISKQQVVDLLNIVGETGEKCCIGQSLDMSMAEKKRYSSINDYISMIELKTGSLIEGSVKGGAVVAGATAKQIEIIGEFGRNMGIAFQIIDDSLDLLGGSKANKSVMNDLKQGKATPMLIYALKNHRSKELLSAVGNKQITSSMAKKVVDIYRSNEAIEYTQNLSHEYIEKARTELNKLPECNASKEFNNLLDIMDYWSIR